MDPSLSEPVAKRADQLVIGDRIQPGYLPAYARSGEGRVMLVDPYAYQGADWVFVAFACADGDRNSTYYLPDGEVKVVPADNGFGYSRADDAETTQPIAGRTPPHVGAMTEGGLVDESDALVHFVFLAGDTACGLLPGEIAEPDAATRDTRDITCEACASAVGELAD